MPPPRYKNKKSRSFKIGIFLCKSACLLTCYTKPAPPQRNHLGCACKGLTPALTGPCPHLPRPNLSEGPPPSRAKAKLLHCRPIGYNEKYAPPRAASPAGARLPAPPTPDRRPQLLLAERCPMLPGKIQDDTPGSVPDPGPYSNKTDSPRL